ncbi:MAG: DUF3795 domain-containing protein [Candidatus Thorarchaeota archaeon]
MKDIFDAYCGIYCGSCIIRLAYMQNRPESIPEPWKTRSKGMDLECHGCKSDHVYPNCAKCEIRTCAKEKHVDYCFTCEDYPCEKIPERDPSEGFPHFTLFWQHQNLLKENKVTEWLAYQKDRFTCKKCGNMFTWYEEICHFCGEKVESVIEELKNAKNDQK